MIENDLQLKITKECRAKFAQRRSFLLDQETDGGRMIKIELDAIESQIAEFDADIAAYTEKFYP